jgi:teichuronic acid biosynthesis glycosyltransferase TuaG
MKKELISVIVPIYNAEKYLEETILSVLNQSYKNFELILVNHASSDGSSDLITKYLEKDKRIKRIDLDINKGGPAYPRNEGLKVAQGEYIAFLDSDDVWFESKLEKQLEFMQYRNLNFSSTSFYEIDKESKILKTSIKTIFLYNIFTQKRNLKSLILHNFIIQSSVMVRLNIFNIYSFNEDKNLIAIEDYYLWLELFINNIQYGFLKDKLVKYRLLDNSTVERNNKFKNSSRRNYVFRKLFLKYENKNIENYHKKIDFIKNILR